MGCGILIKKSLNIDASTELIHLYDTLKLGGCQDSDEYMKGLKLAIEYLIKINK